MVQLDCQNQDVGIVPTVELISAFHYSLQALIKEPALSAIKYDEKHTIMVLTMLSYTNMHTDMDEHKVDMC